jgi:hypothetical protein
MRFLVAVILFAGCVPELITDPDAGEPVVDAGCLRASHEFLEFGELETGTTRVQRVQFKNLTAGPLKVRALPLVSPFGATLDGQPIVPAGTQAAFDVVFGPLDGLLHLSELTVEAESACSKTIALRGLGTGRVIVEPTELDFGGLDVGEFKILEVRLINSRRVAVPLDGLSIHHDQTLSPGIDPPFTIIPPVPTQLPPVSTTTLRVIAQPRLTIHFTSRLVESTLGLSVPMEVLGGTPRAAISPDTFDIPKVEFTPNSTEPSFVERKLMIRNEGTPEGAMSLTLVPPFLRVEREDGGIADAGFTLTFDSALSSHGIWAGYQIPIVIKYLPSEFGRQSFRVVLLTNDPRQAEHPLSFGATVLSLPECSLSAPASVTFTSIDDGGSQGTVTLRNAGSAPCVLDDVRLEDNGIFSFSVLDGGIEQRELAPGEIHEVFVAGPPSGALGTGLLGFHPLSPGSPRRFVTLRAPPR